MTTDARHKPDGITPSQTVGPFFAYALTPGGRYPFEVLAGDDLTVPGVDGEVITLTGRVVDGEGQPILDAFLEIWQADGAGRYPAGAAAGNTGFRGFGRSETLDGGRYRFRTVKPGAVAGRDGTQQAPHICVGVFARGVLRRLYTRIYFPEDIAAHGADPVLTLVPAERRGTLIARRDGPGAYTFDIVLSGTGETVFFEA